jgi:uncharacterized lipoprotein
MLERIATFLLLLTFALAPLSGCAYMSKSGRQQMAYQRYIKKCSGRQMKVKKKIKGPKMPPTPGLSDNHVTTEVSETPQSVSSNEPPPAVDTNSSQPRP